MAETKRSSPSKPRKPQPRKTEAKGGWFLRGLGLAILLPGFVAGVIVLGQYAVQQIENRPRYQFAFAEIACMPPAGMSRADFLSEVQYHAELPDQLNILADNLPKRLAQAFRQHPWVEKVVRVTIDAPRNVTVDCIYREPVLAVGWGDQLRAVDRDGVLLPIKAATTGLPVFSGKAKAPAGPTGAKWGDPDVEAAARKAVTKT